MPDLVLRKTDRTDPKEAWVLQLHYWEELDQSEWVDIKYISVETAGEILLAGAPKVLTY